MRATTTSSGAPFATTAVPNSASFTGLRRSGSKRNRRFHLSNRISATRHVIRENRDHSHPNCISTSTKRIGYAKRWRSMQSAVTLSSSMLVCEHLITRGRSSVSTSWWTSSRVNLRYYQNFSNFKISFTWIARAIDCLQGNTNQLCDQAGIVLADPSTVLHPTFKNWV